MLTLRNIETLIKEFPTPALVISVEGLKVAKANTAFLKTVHKTAEELEGQALLEIFPGLHLSLNKHAFKAFEGLLLEVIETGLPQQVKSLRYGLPISGLNKFEVKYWEIYSYPLLEDGGHFHYLICIIKDVTGQYSTAKAAVHKSSHPAKAELHVVDTFNAIFENTVSAILILDEEGKILEANKTASKMFEYSLLELKTMHKKKLLMATHFNFLSMLSQKEIPETDTGECIGLKKDGTHFFCEYSATAYNSTAGDIRYAIVVQDITAKKLAEDEARLSQNKFKAVIENSEDIIFLTSGDGYILYTSPSFRKIIGFTPEEARLQTIESLIHPANFVEFNDILPDLLRNPGKPFHRISRIKHKKGDYIWVEGTVTNLLHDEAVKAFVYNCKDITARRAAQHKIRESELNLRAIFDNSVEGFVLTSSNLTIKAYNSRARDFILLNESITDFERGKNLLDYIEESAKAHFASQVAKVLEGESVQYTRSVYSQSEGLRWFQFAIYPVKDVEGISCICISGRDITQQKNAEEKLENSERRYRALVENSRDGVVVLSVDSTIKYASGAVSHVLGYSDTELIGTHFHAYLHPENRESLLELLAAFEQFPEYQQEELSFRILHKSGKWCWLECTFSNVIAEKAVNGIVANFKDISERKSTEGKLLKLNSRLKSAQQIARLGYWEYDVIKNEIFWSDEVFEIWGWEKSPKALTFDNFFNSIHPDDREMFMYDLNMALRGEKNHDVIHRIIRRDGSMRYVHEKSIPYYNASKEIIKFEGTVQDVTERVLAEQAVAESEKKYRKLFEESPLPYWIYDLETYKILEVNKAAISSYGYSRNEFLSFSIVDMHPTEDIELLREVIGKQNNEGSYFSQWRHCKKNGDIIKVEITGHRISYNNRNAMMVISKDITEAINAKNELIRSNQRFRYATKATSDAIWDFNLTQNKILLGEGFSTLFGYDITIPEVDSSWMSLNIHPEDMQRVWSGIEEAVKTVGQSHWHDEYRYKKASGEYAIVSNNAVIIRDELGTPYQMIGAMRDVTLLKAEEHRLKLFESVITNASDAVIITNSDFSLPKGAEIIFVNNAFLQMTGYESNEVIGKGTGILIGEKTDEKEIERLAAAMQNGESCQIQTMFHKKSGEVYWAALAIAPVTDAAGKVKNYIAIKRDITERMNYILAIEEQNLKLREIAWTQSHIVRAPLSRILGLVDIMVMDKDPKVIEELLPLLQLSATELDEVIKNIVSKTESL